MESMYFVQLMPWEMWELTTETVQRPLGWALIGAVGHACDVFGSTQPGKFSQQGFTLIAQMMGRPFKKAWDCTYQLPHRWYIHKALKKWLPWRLSGLHMDQHIDISYLPDKQPWHDPEAKYDWSADSLESVTTLQAVQKWVWLQLCNCSTSMIAVQHVRSLSLYPWVWRHGASAVPASMEQAPKIRQLKRKKRERKKEWHQSAHGGQYLLSKLWNSLFSRKGDSTLKSSLISLTQTSLFFSCSLSGLASYTIITLASNKTLHTWFQDTLVNSGKNKHFLLQWSVMAANMKSPRPAGNSSYELNPV